MTYSKARKAAIGAARMARNSHFCVVVTFEMQGNRPFLDYSVMIGLKNGEEPVPDMTVMQACGGSFIMGDDDEAPREYGL